MHVEPPGQIVKGVLCVALYDAGQKCQSTAVGLQRQVEERSLTNVHHLFNDTQITKPPVKSLVSGTLHNACVSSK